jgi:hypothetical protein
VIKTAEERNNLTYHVVLVSVALILSKDQTRPDAPATILMPDILTPPSQKYPFRVSSE